MTAVQNITLELPKQDAERFEKLNATERQMFIRLLSKWLTGEKLDLKTVMDFIGYRAQKRGLTPEILEQILQEENP